MALDGIGASSFQAFAGGFASSNVTIRASTGSNFAPIGSSLRAPVSAPATGFVTGGTGRGTLGATLGPDPLAPKALGPEIPGPGETEEDNAPKIRERDETLAKLYVPPLSLTRNLEQLNDQFRIQFLPLEAFRTYSDATIRAQVGTERLLGSISDIFA